MNIAFLSSLNPTDIHNWSGTLYYMYHHLEKITGSLGPVGSNWKKPSNSTGKLRGRHSFLTGEICPAIRKDADRFIPL